jgi:hypothetical protein
VQLSLGLLCAVLALPVAAARAEPAPKPTPQKLWQAFPLDSTPRSESPANPATARPNATAPRSSGGSSWWIWVAALAAIAALVAAVLAATSVPVRLPSFRRPARSRRDAERGATDVLDDLIEALRTPFQRRPRTSRGANPRRGLTDFVHSIGRSPRPEAESGAGLVTLNAWLSRAGGDSAEDDAEVLKEKLAAHAASGTPKPDEPSAVEDVDLLKAKLQDQAEAKPQAEKTAWTPDKALAAKPRTKPDVDKYRPRSPRKPPLVVIPTAAPGAKADRSRPAEAQRRRADDACTISCWRGYVKSRFYAAGDDGNIIAESRLFRSRDADPAESDEAVAAHRELVAQLEGEAWVPAGKGDRWYELRFRRTAVPAGRLPATARHEREEHHV